MAKQQPQKSSLVPAVIIVLVLALTVGGIAYLYSTSKSPTDVANGTNRANSATNTSRTPPVVPANAPAGASPVYALGQPTATVTVEEFADFQCPSCAVAHPVLKDVQAAFAGNKNVRFIFRHLPLSIHDKAMEAAGAVEAAGMQGVPKFWAMQDQLLTNQRAWANAPNYKEIWRGYAQTIGLDVAKWETDATSMGVRGRIELDMNRANGLGVRSTPTVYINNKPVAFADVNVATMRQLIEAELGNAAGASAPAANAANTSNAAANR
jgi:protein-disulfide isomerase